LAGGPDLRVPVAIVGALSRIEGHDHVLFLFFGPALSAPCQRLLGGIDAEKLDSTG
jgi:hypothetical protein